MVGLGDLPEGGNSSHFRAVSSDGSVAVGFGQSASGGEATRWTEETGMVGLGDVPGGLSYSDAYDVSADGSIVVGLARVADNTYTAFIWNAVDGMRDLKSVLTDDYGLDLTGWELRTATAISDDGRVIVGSGLNPDGRLEAWKATIPEPATLGMLALGGLAMLRRRRSSI
jgi:probable HAF family extracellular repeat protein